MGSKVFEFLEGGAAARNAGRRKLNVFATSGVATAMKGLRMAF
jgi:hypothetical protein